MTRSLFAKLRFGLVSGLLLGAVAAPAQSGGEALRAFSTDRPDKTESPYTVPNGHAQIELDGATFTEDVADGVRTETVGIVPFNLKYGIGENTDLQLVVAPYTRQTVTDRITGARDRIGGFGDVTIRLKHNLWGNDGGTTALGLMPFVTLPTAKDGLGAEGVEFGLIVPLAITLSDTVDLGLMTEVDGLREDGHYRASFVNSATMGFSLTDQLGLYTELYTEHDRDWIVTADTGLTYAIGSDTQLDLGANFGVTDAADDLGVFVGFSRRF